MIEIQHKTPYETGNILRFRNDFPILKREINGHPLVYLDNAATTQKPDRVIHTLSSYYNEYNANVHRALYTIAGEATEAYETARKRISQYIGAHNPQEIIFTGGTTSALNMLALSLSHTILKADDIIVLTELEHHSNLIPWQIAAKHSGAKLELIPFDAYGRLDLDWLDSHWSDRIKIISCTHMSNVFGSISDIKKLSDFSHRNNALLIVDGAQSTPHLKINVQELDCDFYAFSGHKIYGPMGIGVLYGKRQALEQLEPVFGGGEMIKSVWADHATWNDIPHRFEPGTPNVAGAIGLSAALDYIDSVGHTLILKHEQALIEYSLQKLQELDYVTIYGPEYSDDRGGVISFNIKSVHAHDAAQILDTYGIAVRAGHHCAQPLMRKLNVDATLRISFGLYNTLEEIDLFIEHLQKVRELMGYGI